MAPTRGAFFYDAESNGTAEVRRKRIAPKGIAHVAEERKGFFRTLVASVPSPVGPL